MPAPRKALSLKKVKYGTAEEIAAMLPKLMLIKAKHAARVLQLSRSALQAMKEIAAIEAAMETEATADVHQYYEYAVTDFKMTFEATYAQDAEDADDTAPRLDDCMDILSKIEKDAAAAIAAAAAEASLREPAVEEAPADEASLREPAVEPAVECAAAAEK